MININELLKKQELYWNESKKQQVMDKESIWYGGYNFVNETVMSRAITQGLCLYCEKDSPLYKDEDVLLRMKLNSEYLLKFQNKSGLISLLNCNIDSPPDTAFWVNDLAIAHFYIEKSGMQELKEIDDNILKFLDRTQAPLITGGFHTPNHRWVITCALGFLYRIFKNEDLRKRANDYLAEGIDINTDGEWTERSNSVYNAVSDLYMYHIGESFGLDEAFDAVRKNLDMMKYLLHPNDYIATEYSTRQDKGVAARMDARYTISYMLMAKRDNNPQYVYMAEKAIKNAANFGLFLMYARLYEDVFFTDIKPEPISNKYIKLINEGSVTEVPKAKSKFGDSVLRYRDDDLSITVMAGQPDFLFFQNGNARIFGIRFTFGWFGMGGVSFPTVEKINDKTYRMSTKVMGKYWQVLPGDVAGKYNGNFNAMPNNSREDINKVYFDTECIITLCDDGIELDLSADCEYFLFTQLVCMLDADGSLECDNSTKMNAYVTRLDSGSAVYTNNGSVIEVEGNGAEHDLDIIRGDNLNRDAKNLVLNWVNPKHKKVIIKCK